MKFDKIIATFISAIMLVTPVLGAYDLGDYPAFLFTDHKLEAYVVVGADAMPADVVGAVDLATRLAGESYEEVSSGGTSTVVSGGKTEDVAIASQLTRTGYFDVNFDDDDLTGLVDSSVSFAGDTYDYHEEVILSTTSPMICNSLNCSEDNYKDGVYMEIATGALSYYYIFDEAIYINNSVSTTYPLKITFLGKQLKITNAGTATQGDRFTAYVGDSYSMSVGDCVESEGKTVCLENVAQTGSTVIVTIDGTKYTITGTETQEGIEIAVDDTFYSDTLSERAATIVLGKDAQETYIHGNKYRKDDNICNNDPNDTDCWEWVIGGLNTNAATTGTPPSAGPRIGITSRFVINDMNDNPITAGGCYKFPNDYASVCFDSLTVSDDKYANIQIEVAKGVTLNSSGNFDNEDVLYIHSDVTEGLQIESDALGILTGRSATALTSDTKTQQIWLAPDFGGTNAMGNLSVWYLASDGTKKYVGDINCNASTGYGTKFARVYYGDTKDDNIEFYCANASMSSTNINITLDILGKTTTDLPNLVDDLRTLWTVDADSFNYLGSTEGDADVNDLLWCRGTNAACNWFSIGTKDEDHRTDYGIIIVNPDSTGNNEKIELKVPNEQVFAKVVIKGPGTTITSGAEGNIKKVVPIETAVAKLDTEISLPVGKHLVLIGDAAVNKLSAQVMGLTYPTYGASGLFPYSQGEGYIKVYEGVLETGKITVLVAGWDAADTRNAASVLQQCATFADKLDGNVAVKVTSVSAAGITPVVETAAEETV